MFVLDTDGTVTYEWIADDLTNEPDYDELLTAVRDVLVDSTTRTDHRPPRSTRSV